MKNTLILLLLSAGALYAQVPHIDYMMADEAKSQLQIHGTFGPDHTGNALIEGVPCSIRFWSDTMVICDLPDSGAGSGGHVTVEQMSGTSNTRMLSIFVMTIENPFFYVGYQSNIGTIFGPGAGQTIWNVNWRADIASRPKNVSSLVQFEISKSSKGTWKLLTYPNVELCSSDSLHFSDSSIALFGQLDLIKFKVIFMLTRMQSYPDNGVVIPNSAIPY
jgi:hypothetical protein